MELLRVRTCPIIPQPKRLRMCVQRATARQMLYAAQLQKKLVWSLTFPVLDAVLDASKYVYVDHKDFCRRLLLYSCGFYRLRDVRAGDAML